MTPLRTALVDDEPLARMRLRTLLVPHVDFSVSIECADGRSALATIQREKPDVIFLDVEMPEMKGVELARAVQFDPSPAIVFVTAFPEHAVDAFAISAIDYLLKPYDEERFLDALDRVRVFVKNRKLRESHARLLSHLQRDGSSASSWAADDEDAIIRLSGLRIDLGTRTVTRNEQSILLRPKEFDLLVELAGRAGTVVYRRKLLSEVWRYDSNVVSRTVDTHVGELRKKLGIEEGQPGFIEAVFGVGYRMRL